MFFLPMINIFWETCWLEPTQTAATQRGTRHPPPKPLFRFLPRFFYFWHRRFFLLHFNLLDFACRRLFFGFRHTFPVLIDIAVFGRGGWIFLCGTFSRYFFLLRCNGGSLKCWYLLNRYIQKWSIQYLRCYHLFFKYLWQI